MSVSACQKNGKSCERTSDCCDKHSVCVLTVDDEVFAYLLVRFVGGWLGCHLYLTGVFSLVSVMHNVLDCHKRKGIGINGSAAKTALPFQQENTGAGSRSALRDNRFRRRSAIYLRVEFEFCVREGKISIPLGIECAVMSGCQEFDALAPAQIVRFGYCLISSEYAPRHIHKGKPGRGVEIEALIGSTSANMLRLPSASEYH
ncbi:hypothetical protein DEU56DRAFT_902580 [Suillus clintonianus]|uniref:uncharacterized protein n=1 Tax=Suillus clintonianus TaxID=1904413 RepID=UPI001B883EDE|nr:uncharacterized protein DEU56DRAFT_902580 [Suillus clintonianus]KAG2130860.1 hypothetical protein DEU56DRAFT_902580 [Suillus clintonianus]